MADYFSPTVIQPTIPVTDITPLERLLLSHIFNAEGEGVVTDRRLYQLVRQPKPIGDRLFEIEFLDAGAEAFCFTFG